MKVIVLLIATIAASCNYLSHIPDKELIARFGAHKPEFIRLAKLLVEDKRIVRLTKEDVFYSHNGDQPVSDDRLREYRELLERLQLDSGIHRDNESTVRFIASTNGLLGATSEKSFVFSEAPVSPVVDSLDGLEGRPDQQQTFRKIEDNWFLVYESW